MGRVRSAAEDESGEMRESEHYCAAASLLIMFR